MSKRRILLDFILEHKVSYIIGLIFMLIACYVQTLFPKVLGRTIDILKVSNFDISRVKLNIIYILIIALGAFLSTYAWRNLIIRNSREFECELRDRLFTHFQKLSPEFYNRRKTGDLIAYAINDISAVRMTLGPATAMSINGIAICAAAIYSMLQSVNLRLTVICLAPIPIIIVVMLQVGKLVQKRFRKVQESFSAISDRVQENIYGIRVIKAYVQEDEELKNFEKLNNNMMDANMDMVRVASMLSPIIEICFSISFVVNLIVGGNMVLKNTISLGDFIAFNTYLTMIMTPIISIGRIINILQRGMASYKRINEIFNTEPDITDGKAMIDKEIKGCIEFKNLNFAYPGSDEQALKDICLTINQGENLGIIGRTGAGKTTLSSLLLKLYNVEDGKIFVDGIDINHYRLDALRNGFGYVPQDNFLFSATVKDNIGAFKKAYSMEQVKKAAEASCIYENIIDLQDGFNTILGERGVNLSGGQKQRIAIARAVIKEPAVLILDDSLSAVDTITEQRILENFKDIRKDKTAIIIAHKISSVQDCDQIIVLDKGRICESGTHNELLKKGGLYYDIYREQWKDRKRCENEAS
ncbi:ABC transporter ATP-binding protein [Clostridium omnivorum]|uniref:ATPase n=1 Tax=Clostridium omnivorum TaxID=1604902 RepID=A0ABQ5N8X2_9CLOT|nr:ABC transporter ATP-binding protein [Clostridium sp. E14]GLC31539.1 ATPase [Clostridium sp. E14]